MLRTPTNSATASEPAAPGKRLVEAIKPRRLVNGSNITAKQPRNVLGISTPTAVQQLVEATKPRERTAKQPMVVPVTSPTAVQQPIQSFVHAKIKTGRGGKSLGEAKGGHGGDVASHNKNIGRQTFDGAVVTSGNGGDASGKYSGGDGGHIGSRNTLTGLVQDFSNGEFETGAGGSGEGGHGGSIGSGNT